MAKIVVKREEAENSERELTGDVTSIGRDATSDIVLADSSVSRRHARIEKSPSGHYRIVDLESGNGILHHGKRVQALDLYPGCEIEIGRSTLRFESDAAVPVLVLIGGASQRSYPIVTEETFLGRSPENAIAVPDPLVSSRHLKIVRKGSLHAVVDLESDNGTRVNGVRVSSRELQQGDQIQVGGFTFFFALDGVVPSAESVRIIQATSTGTALPVISPASASPPPAPTSAAARASAKAAQPSRSRLLLIAAGLFAFLFVIVIFLLVRSPDDSTEKEFQEVFQADLNAEEQARIEEYLAQAKDYEGSGNLPLALEQYRKILVLNETHHQAQAESARLEEAIEADAAARAERERLERERSAQVAALAENAAALLAEAKFDEARKILEEARGLSPDSSFLKTKLIEAYVAEGDYFRNRNAQRAKTAYEQALALDPGSAAAQRGVSGMEEGRRASRERQKKVEDLTAQGLAQLKNEQFRQAYASFSEVLKLDPGNARAKDFRDQAAELLEAEIRPMYDEGVRLYNANQLAPAMAQFQKVLQLNPDHAETKSFLGKASEKVRAEAVDVYKKAYIYEGLGRLKDALELYRQCIALLPDPREEYHQKANQRIEELNRKLP